MSACSFCHEPGHRIQHCNSHLISTFEKCIRYNAAYDYYLGLQSTYLQLYLISLDLNVLRAIGYRHKIILKKKWLKSNNSTCIPYKIFIKKFLVHYLIVPNIQHIELINSLSYLKIELYSLHIHDFILRNNIHTNWTPTTIATMLLSTRIFSIELTVMNDCDLPTQIDDCSICIDKISTDKYCKLLCNHSFCSSCVFQYIKTLYKSNKDDPVCPLCRDKITYIMVTQSNYKNCLQSISVIKNMYKLNRIQYNVNDDEDESFDLRIEYCPIFLSEHPQFIRMKYAFYVIIRMFVFITYIEFMFRLVYYMFKTANSYRNPNMLQI